MLTVTLYPPPELVYAGVKNDSELEYEESVKILRTVATSDELYDRLGQYYKTISEKTNQKLRKRKD